MDSLANYGSDDDYSSENEKKAESKYTEKSKKSSTKADDVNYDDVEMDLSEGSDNEKRSHEDSNSKKQDRERRTSPKYSRKSSSRSRSDEKSEKSRYSRDRRSSRDRHSKYDDSRDYKSRDYRRRSRSRDNRRRSRSRSRSRSRDRAGYSRKYDRTNNKIDRLGKMGIQINKTSQNVDGQQDSADTAQNNGRFFMPGISGRFRDQIERRKMLWQKKTDSTDTKEVPASANKRVVNAPTTGVLGSGGSRATKVWETTTFAQDTDGKMVSKFKRLMGMKNETGGQQNPSDILKKQEEMFTSMEQQYEVARTVTHTMRGVGLGFGSFQK